MEKHVKAAESLPKWVGLPGWLELPAIYQIAGGSGTSVIRFQRAMRVAPRLFWAIEPATWQAGSLSHFGQRAYRWVSPEWKEGSPVKWFVSVRGPTSLVAAMQQWATICRSSGT